MAMNIQNRSTAIAAAVAALLDEDHALSAQIATLSARLEQVRVALNAMKPLMAGETHSTTIYVERMDEAEDQADDESSSGPFAGLKFSQALKKYMDGLREPMSTTELARGFEEAGWKFRSPQPSAKVNQVGVTLRRFRGKLFSATPDGRWMSTGNLFAADSRPSWVRLEPNEGD